MLKKRAVPKKRLVHKQFFRQWREHLGHTQERALDRLGWSQSKLSRIESGATIWNASDLAELEAAYGVSSYLLLNTDPKKDGEVVDLMSLITDKNRDQAIRVLKALTG